MNGISTIHDGIEPLCFFFVWDKNPVTQCTDILLGCWCAWCDFWWSFVKDWFIVSNDFLLKRCSEKLTNVDRS